MCADMKYAIQLFEEALLWLQMDYRHFRFFTERDIEWKLQLHLLEEIDIQHLPLNVFENHKMPNNKRVDLAILERSTGSILFVAELKYEPDGERPDIYQGKFPKVSWGSEKNYGVVQDINRIDNWIKDGSSDSGYAVFIDEGGYYSKHKEKYKAPAGSTWDYNWGESPVLGKTMAMLSFKRQSNMVGA